MKEKQKTEYFFQGDFLFRIGWVSYQKAHEPLAVHDHGKCIEFVFMLKGCQHYLVEGKEYKVQGGEVFITYPGEIHGTGEKLEEKAIFYYLIVDLECVWKEQYGCIKEEKELYLKLLESGKRIQALKKEYAESCSRLMNLCQGNDNFKKTKIRNQLSELLLRLGEGGKEEKRIPKENKMDIILDYIQKHIKEELEIEDLIKLFCGTPPRFWTCFYNSTGVSPREYITREKVQNCKKELQKTEKSITEIAFEYGFSSSQYFATVFRKYCGTTPSYFRNHYKQKDKEQKRGYDMTKRENFFCAMSHKEPEQIPFFLRLCEELEREFVEKYGINDYRLYFGSSIIPVKLNPTRKIYDYSKYFKGVHCDSFNEWGVGFRAGSSGYHFRQLISPMRFFETPDEVWEFPIPDILEDYRWEGIEKKISELKAQDKITMNTSGCNIDIFEPAWYLRGLENLLEDMLINEEMAEACLERMCQIKCKMAKRCAEVGFDVVVFGDDVATQRGMMMSVSLWRKWLKPRLAKAIEGARNVNPKVLCYYHSDGDITAIIDDLIEIGVDILNPIQPECMEPRILKEQYGDKINFWGTIGTQTTMPFGTAQQVKEKVWEMAETVGKDGGLVLAPTHVLEPEVPWENIEAFVSACKSKNR